MKAYLSYPITILIFFTFIVAGCRSTKRLNENQALVTKLEIKGVDEEFEEQAADYVSVDIRPNSRFNLWFYNTFNKKGNKKIGEAPHILDSSLVEVSRNQIEKFLHYKGYLNAKVDDSIKVENKKAHITYTVNSGTLFKFRNISFDIRDSVVKDLYLSQRSSFSKISPGSRYDVDSLVLEREKIYDLMKRNGYYDFLRQYVRHVVDTNLNVGLADVMITILNPADKDRHPIYSYGNTNIRISPSSGVINNVIPPDTVLIKDQYQFYDYSKLFDEKKLADFIFINKGNTYNSDDTDLTTQRLFDLNVFKSINIDYKKTSDSSGVLDANISIIPLKKKSNRLDGEYTFNSSITGFNVGLTYQNRNLFGGAELLELKGIGGLQFDRDIRGSLNSKLQSSDYQFGASLTFPRLLAPVKIPRLEKNGVPRTRIGVNYQVYKLGTNYLRRGFGTTFGYEWVETKFKTHAFTPISIQYSQGVISRPLADSLIKSGNIFFLYTLRSQLVSSSIYSYTLNAIKLNTLEKFIYFYGSLEVGGNTASLFANIKKDFSEDGKKQILGVPYYQFVRMENDTRFYRHLGNERQLVLRINPGIGIPYGNGKDLPFEKQFFAGGSNGIRAWQARTLGPGNYNRSQLASDTLRRSLRNLDQLGDLKFQGNIEYRWKILDNFFGAKLKGATFLDFGNIWKLRSGGFEGSKFEFDKIWDQMAVGTGVGLRFDVSFFVFRLDVGLKVKDPQFVGGNQYVIKNWFSGKRELKDSYRITNSPDRYSISQIQFGVGLPF